MKIQVMNLRCNKIQNFSLLVDFFLTIKNVIYKACRVFTLVTILLGVLEIRIVPFLSVHRVCQLDFLFHFQSLPSQVCVVAVGEEEHL